MGVNDRKELDIMRTVENIQEIYQWYHTKNKTSAWISIPEFENLDPEALENIQQINK